VCQSNIDKGQLRYVIIIITLTLTLTLTLTRDRSGT
jgi:hypothetical protein